MCDVEGGVEPGSEVKEEAGRHPPSANRPLWTKSDLTPISNFNFYERSQVRRNVTLAMRDRYPSGFEYFPAFLSPKDEQDFLQAFTGFDWETIRFRGQEAKRKMVCFGWQYLISSSRFRVYFWIGVKDLQNIDQNTKVVKNV